MHFHFSVFVYSSCICCCLCFCSNVFVINTDILICFTVYVRTYVRTYVVDVDIKNTVYTSLGVAVKVYAYTTKHTIIYCCMSCYRKAIAVNYRRQLVHVFPSGSQVFEHFVGTKKKRMKEAKTFKHTYTLEENQQRTKIEIKKKGKITAIF